MSIFTSRPVLRWAVPAAAAVAVVGAGVAAKTLAVAAEPNLPPRTAAQLLVDLQTAKLDGLSGTVVERADLGLPDLGALGALVGQEGSSNLTSLVAGKHTLRVWYSGPDKARLALVGTNGESDIIRNGKDLWFWDSKANTATHHVLSSDEAKAGELNNKAPDLAGNLPKTPQEAADLALKAIDPSTQVSVGRSTKIAGRDAYELNLTPRDHASLVGQISVAIDATEHVPLRFRIYPSASDKPAFEAAFTMVSFARPDDAQFAFNPPPGTKVTEGGMGVPGLLGMVPPENAQPDKAIQPEKKAGSEPTVIGTGWTTVIMAKLDQSTDEAPAEISGLLGQLPKVSGSWGSGRLFTSRLATALLTDDGRVFFGPVSPEKLYEVAASHR